MITIFMEQKQITALKKLFSELEDKLAQAKQVLTRASVSDSTMESEIDTSEESVSVGEGSILYGIFNGENFLGDDGEVYPINPNYASKSKLVEGDTLKLTISPEGKLTFKTINPTARKWSVAKLSSSEGEPKVTVDGKEYKVLYASITYYRAKTGDTLSVIIPTRSDASWATIDAVLPKSL
jgi:hypothetical protein